MASRLLVVALVLLMPLAGCFGKKQETPTVVTKAATTNATSNATLPDGRGTSLGNIETNKTENGTGGIDHKHDYWKGREQIVVLQQDLAFFPQPLFPDGQGTSPKDVAYLKLPNTTAVYEGTEKLSVLLVAPAASGVAAPMPPAVSLQYRSAADATWREPLALPYGTPLEIKVKPVETDMPHSTQSLWVFRLTTDRPDVGLFPMNLTMTIFRGREVVNWPGHPDFYADSNVRKVADTKHVKTHMTGAIGSLLYDQGGTWAAPDKLVSYGTSKLLVIVNITGISTQTNQAATGFFLEVHNATVIGPEVLFGDRYSEKDKKNDLKSYQFEVPVDAGGMDGPYQPASRWGFRAMATFAQLDIPVVGGIGICPGCFDYDIEYDLTVFAIHETDAPTIAM